ncbi:hypothetical protein BSG1_09463 [Bacillus sp. SG-1]|nr:hypothetical protein BSG1_09463 [Bacillus sp. SG-1]
MEVLRQPLSPTLMNYLNQEAHAVTGSNQLRIPGSRHSWTNNKQLPFIMVWLANGVFFLFGSLWRLIPAWPE